jgi:hypothetical protein
MNGHHNHSAGAFSRIGLGPCQPGETNLRWLARPDPNFGKVLELSQPVFRVARRAAEMIDRTHAMATRKSRAGFSIPPCRGTAPRALAIASPAWRGRARSLRPSPRAFHGNNVAFKVISAFSSFDTGHSAFAVNRSNVA